MGTTSKCDTCLNIFFCILTTFLFLLDECTDWINGLELLRVADIMSVIESSFDWLLKRGETDTAILVNSSAENASEYVDEVIYNMQRICSNLTNESMEETFDDAPPKWFGFLTITFTFLPGWIFGWYVIFGAWPVRGACHVTMFLIGVIIVPVLFVVIYPFITVFIIIDGFAMDDETGIDRVLLVEAFFEAAPQLLLQCHIYASGRPATLIQILCIVSSFITLCKKAMDAQLGEWPRDMCTIMKHHFSNLPIYALSLIFRTGTLVVLVTLFKFWTAIPIVIIIFIQQRLYWWYENHIGDTTLETINGSLLHSVTNIFIVSIYALSRSYKTINKSSILILVCYIICLVITLCLFNLQPALFSHWSRFTSNCSVKRSGLNHENINYLCGSLIAVGVLQAVIQVLYTRNKWGDLTFRTIAPESAHTDITSYDSVSQDCTPNNTQIHKVKISNFESEDHKIKPGSQVQQRSKRGSFYPRALHATGKRLSANLP